MITKAPGKGLEKDENLISKPQEKVGKLSSVNAAVRAIIERDLKIRYHPDIPSILRVTDNHLQIADSLLESGQGEIIIRHFKHFENLNFSVLDKMIELGHVRLVTEKTVTFEYGTNIGGMRYKTLEEKPDDYKIKRVSIKKFHLSTGDIEKLQTKLIEYQA